MSVSPMRRHTYAYTLQSSIQEEPEFEPVDLNHLNIKACLISINSKITSKNPSRQLTKNDLEPTFKKLKSALQSLERTASLCYAVEALHSARNQIESFFAHRLRRYIIFSEALTAFVIAVYSSSKSFPFLEQVCNTKLILAQFEGLLSCHAEETGMLQDMQYAIESLNKCVTVTFEKMSMDVSPQMLLPRLEGNRLAILIWPDVILYFSLSNLVCFLSYHQLFLERDHSHVMLASGWQRCPSVQSDGSIL